MKLCLNGHEWAKRQLEKTKIAYEALDNGFLSCISSMGFAIAISDSDLRQQMADLRGVTLKQYTPHQMTCDLRRLRLKGLIYRPPKTNRYFVTPYG